MHEPQGKLPLQGQLTLRLDFFRNFLQVMEGNLDTFEDSKREDLKEKVEELVTEQQPGLKSTEQTDADTAFLYNLLVSPSETTIWPLYRLQMRFAFIVLLCSFLEPTLREICSRVKKDKSLHVSLGDIRGSNYLDRVKTYLNKVACLGRVPEGLPEAVFQPVKFIVSVRNCISHSFGRMDGTDTRDQRIVTQQIEQWPDIELDDGSIRIIGNTFCEQALKEVQTFFNHIFSVLPSTIE